MTLSRSTYIGACACALVLAWCGGTARADDSSSDTIIKNFAEAFAGDDSTPKREAVRSVSSLGKENDDEAYKLLVQAVNDRQTHDDAVLALRTRTGLAPTINNRGTGYPGYPNSDDASDWNAWLAARTKEKSDAKKIADQELKLKALENPKKKDSATKDAPGKDGTTPPASGETATVTAPPAPRQAEPPNDLGHPSRIIFKNGSSLVCYVTSKRLDSDGVVQSVRIVHLEGGGEETLSADLIVRIDENIR
jgi:hypothetical protein